MKPRHAAALALVMLAGCTPDIAAINVATERSEAAANRAEKSAERTDRSASQAFDTSVRVLELEDSAEQSRKGAQDSVSRMEAFWANSRHAN